MNDVGNSNPVNESYVNASACQKLWAAVLIVQWGVVFKSKKGCAHYKLRLSSLEVDQAKRWFGGGDFSHVCHLAGVDPEYVLDKFKAKYAALGGML